MNTSAIDIQLRYDKLINKSTVYSYFGKLDTKEMNAMLEDMESILNKQIEKKIIRKKLFHILIEITQNLVNYFEDREPLKNLHDIFLVVNKSKKGYVIITGNYIVKEEIPSVKTRIDMVNIMSESELKELYRGILNFGGVSNGGGAGLGFVDLARRSGEKLKYAFDQIDKKLSFFTLEVLVNQ